MTGETRALLAREGVTAEDIEATYAADRCEEADALLKRSREWRRDGDHLAAGLLERDAAALCDDAHMRRAIARARARLNNRSTPS